MSILIAKEADKIWGTITKKGYSDITPYCNELELHKVLLNFFSVGDFYYYVFNVPEMKFDFISPEIEKILGYAPKELTVNNFIKKIHPDDQAYFLNFENTAVRFLKSLPSDKLGSYKTRYDYRMKKKNGEYIRVLQQAIRISWTKEGQVLKTLGMHTDISYLKSESKPVLSFIGINGEPSYYNVKVDEIFKPSKLALTPRERQVLGLIVQGLSSKTIAENLCIGKQTVDTHRRNLLQKTETKNTAQLIALAIRQGLV